MSILIFKNRLSWVKDRRDTPKLDKSVQTEYLYSFFYTQLRQRRNMYVIPIFFISKPLMHAYNLPEYQYQ